MKLSISNRLCFNDYGGATENQTIDACLFLRAIINNDTLAHYPTEIRIGKCYDGTRNWDASWQCEKQDVAVGALADCQDAIMAKIEACPCIEREKQEMWTQAIFCGRESTVAMLILHLPNSRPITISDSTKNLGRPGAVFSIIHPPIGYQLLLACHPCVVSPETR